MSRQTASQGLPNPPEPPPELREAGRRLWNDVLGHLELDEHMALTLLEACRVADRLDALDVALREHGPALPDGRPSPLLAEARQQQITYTRLIASMRLPDDLQRGKTRPQRRGGSRGTYMRAVK